MEHDPNSHPAGQHGVEARLRRLGTEPLPEHLAEPPAATFAPLTRTTAAASRWGRRPLVAAAAAVALVLGGGVSWAAMGSNPGPGLATGDAPPEQTPPAFVDDLVPAQVGDDEDEEDEDENGNDENGNDENGNGNDVEAAPAEEENGDGEFPHVGDDCKGPPLWVTDPDEASSQHGEHRADQALAHALIRSECPDAENGDENGEIPHDGDDCKGPPAFLHPNGENGEPATAENDENGNGENGNGENGNGEAAGPGRAAEALDHARTRAQCPDDENGDNGDNGDNGGPPDHAGPPEGVPSGPPEGVPGGPPEGVPSGPPEGVPGPEGRSGPPEGVPAGPPAGVDENGGDDSEPPAQPGPPAGVAPPAEPGPPAGVPGGRPGGDG